MLFEDMIFGKLILQEVFLKILFYHACRSQKMLTVLFDYA